MFFTLENSKSQEPAIKDYYILGTIIQLKVYGRKAEKAIKESIERLHEIDDKMSVFKENSEISKINKSAGISSEKVSNDTFFVIKEAKYYSELSEGSFDPTIRPLVSIWGFGRNVKRIPEKSEIEEKLSLVNYKDITLSDKNKTVKLEKINQALDVGGIAKGYAADEVKEIMKKNRISSAIIDLGGNIFAHGKKIDGANWNIGIQNPLTYRGDFIGTIAVESKSIVTSGNYERYFEKEGKKFHHIIDPRTGYPSESEIISATIISDKSIDGDGLSTGVYILGIHKAIELVESMKGIDAIFITKDKKVYTTSGIKQDFKLFKKDFILESI